MGVREGVDVGVGLDVDVAVGTKVDVAVGVGVGGGWMLDGWAVTRVASRSRAATSASRPRLARTN